MSAPHFLLEDYDISFLSAFKTAAKSRYYMDIITYEDILLLPEIYRYAESEHIPVTIIGAGTNCLFAFDRYEGILLRNRYTGYSEPYAEGGEMQIRVNSGEVSTVFAHALYTHYQISTLIPWIGLPGTMGGACIGNAGCFGLETTDMLIEARLLDTETGVIYTMRNTDFDYRYRHSRYKEDARFFIIDMVLRLSDTETNPYVAYTPADLQALRRLKQPPGFSCGSFFQNPKVDMQKEFIGGKEGLLGERGHMEEWSAGKLIDEAGLKGTRVGGIHVSERHGNFFINDKKGTWQDVIALRDQVVSTILQRYGIRLREEVRIITNP